MSTRAQVDPSDFTGLADWVEDYGRLAVGDGRRPEIIAALRHAAGLQDRLATAEAENERHRGANLVRAVMHGADPEWIADLVSAESFDAIPWQIAYRIRSEAVARRKQP